MESEVELNSAIQELHVISTRPDLYPYLLDSNSIELLLSILSHENIDIVGAVISFLQELADLDPAMESVENIKALVDYLVYRFLLSLIKLSFKRILFSVSIRLSRFLLVIWNDLMRRTRTNRTRCTTL